MYNETIKVANKIISDSVLSEIFEKMNEEIEVYKRIKEEEEKQNEKYERNYQKWTVKDFEGKFKCTFNFYDDTNIDVDNYYDFQNIFNNRLHDVKSMWVRYSYMYTIFEEGKPTYVNKSINMDIHEERMDIDVHISSEDDKMNNVYNLIKEKILTAPEKYDRVVKRRSSIITKVGICIGLIPSSFICLLLLISPEVREFYAKTYVTYPIIVLILAYIIGNVIAHLMLGKYYTPLLPERVYAGYDSSKQKSIYKDDIEKYVGTSEIIIGKNVDNLKNRKEILDIESKYTSFALYEFIGLVVLSIIVIIMGKLL